MVHYPTLKQLKYLCAVAEHLHFGHAAEACHVSQSTLSASIQELEDNLGVSLLERNNKHVLITPVGQDILRRSQQILTEVEDLIANANASSQPFTGHLRLGVIPTIAPYLLPELLQSLRRQYPQLKLFIREDLSAQLVQALKIGELDVLLLALPFPSENTESVHLFYDEFLLAYDADHAVAKLKKISTGDLKGMDLLLLEDGHCLRDHALDACQLSASDFNIPFQATSLNTIIQMVANQIGITLIPRMALEHLLLSNNQVKTRAFDGEKVQRSIGLMWRKKSPRQQELETISELIKQLNIV